MNRTALSLAVQAVRSRDISTLDLAIEVAIQTYLASPVTRPEAEIRNEGIEMAAKWLDDLAHYSGPSMRDELQSHATAIRALKEPRNG
jgi:hypothetical protein